MPYKLLLTGYLHLSPEVSAFLNRNDLHHEVLCLWGLTEQELAGCYKQATLAVTPSLSEGGMPFTFAEAVSVGTPVVMADIAVTREVMTSKSLRESSLFDPYD